MTHKTPDPIEALIKTFLTEGTKEGYGDLSGMVSHITQAYAAGETAGREKEREEISERRELFNLREMRDDGYGLTAEEKKRLKELQDRYLSKRDTTKEVGA